MDSRIEQLRRKLLGKAHLHESYQAVFGTPEGQKVLRHLLKVGNVFTSSFAPGDKELTAFREGQRHIVLSILKFVNKNHDEMLRTIEEELQNANEDII